MIKRNTTLYWVISNTAFEAINKKAFVSNTRPLGTGTNAVAKMLACDEEMKFLLPNILGISPGSSNTDWTLAVSNYWHNLNIDVPMEGYRMNTSLIVDINDPLRKSYIETLLTKELKVSKDAKDDAKVTAIEEYLEKDTTPEEVKYRYSIPEDVSSYLVWRFCLVYGKVANVPDVMGNTTKIEFFLMDAAIAEKKREEGAKIKNKAIRRYSELLSEKNVSKIDDLLIASNNVSSLGDLKKLSNTDKENILLDMATAKPTDFLNLVNNNNLEVTSKIKKLTMGGLINNLPMTSIYVDASDPSKVLGNSISEVITYISNIANQVYVNELDIKYNALK